jgi:hypothetical protein
MPQCDDQGEGQYLNPEHRWDPEPVYFERRDDTTIICQRWPPQIEVEKSLIALVEPGRIVETDLHVTFNLDNGSQRYRIIGERGDGVLQCQRDPTMPGETTR